MKKLRRASSVTAVALTAALVAGSALAGTTAGAAKKKPKKPVKVAFVGSYTGNATVKVADNVANIDASGSGTGSLIGAGKITGTGTGDSSQQPCVPFKGPATIAGAKGTLALTVIPTSSACGDEQGQSFTISGKANVTKGTGKLLKAKGLLRFTGTYDHGSGAFTVKFTGSLTK